MYYVGIDLHSNNSYLAVKDETGRAIYHKRLNNNLDEISMTLSKWSDISGIVVESTYNWYWLIDGLKNYGYTVHLANPAKMQMYNGLKNVNDKTDAFHLAEMLRLNCLPVGYIYPKSQRPLRDILRRRMLLVRQRTQNILSFQGLLSRNLGYSISSNEIKKMKEEQIEKILHPEIEILNGKAILRVIIFLTKQINEIEKIINKNLKNIITYKNLMTVDGIGETLAATIYLETGDINRFKTVGNYASYSRVVKGEKISNKKNKGAGNKKNGNKYLSWAYGEAAVTIQRYCPEAKKFYQKKKSKRNTAVAYRALAHKLARACYFIMKENTVFDSRRIFSS